MQYYWGAVPWKPTNDEEGPPLRESASKVVSLGSARRRIQPPSYLRGEELRIFSDTVGSYPPPHFVESDKLLLSVYCTAVHLAGLYADHGSNEVARRMHHQTARLVAVLANRLRLGSRL